MSTLSTAGSNAARARRQSHALVAILAPVLAAMCVQWMLIFGVSRLPLVMLGISLTFAALVWALRAATPAAAATGALICFLIGLGTCRSERLPFASGLTPLAALFALTFLATRIGHRTSRQTPAEEIKRGRGAAQVLANLGIAALVGSGFLSILVDRFDRFDRLGPNPAPVGAHLWSGPVLLLAALAEATADTLSSELGQAFGGTPVLLTTLRRVAPGTDGAITPLGTAAGIAGAAMITLAGALAMHLSPGTSLIAFTAAVAGLFFDSLLGATAEPAGWLGNDLVNFSSTLFAVVCAEVLFLLLG